MKQEAMLFIYAYIIVNLYQKAEQNKSIEVHYSKKKELAEMYFEGNKGLPSDFKASSLLLSRYGHFGNFWHNVRICSDSLRISHFS